MPDNASRVTRVAADLMESAAVEGARQSRSAKQQLDHWARVGRAVSGSTSSARRKVEAALAGTIPLSDLDAEQAVVFNAEITAGIEESLACSDYGAILAARGVTTVALDDNGDLVQYRPDGGATALNTSPRAR